MCPCRSINLCGDLDLNKLAGNVSGCLVARFSRELSGRCASILLDTIGVNVVKVELHFDDDTRNWVQREVDARAVSIFRSVEVSIQLPLIYPMLQIYKLPLSSLQRRMFLFVTSKSVDG